MLTTGTSNSLNGNDAPSPQNLPALRYSENGLEPVIRTSTISFHYRRHHPGYVDYLNNFIAGTEYARRTLVKIITSTTGLVERAVI